MNNKDPHRFSAPGGLAAALRAWGEISTRGVLSSGIAYCRRHGVTMAQVGALHHLMTSGSSMVSAIGDELGVTSAAVSQMLDRLVQQGYVQRTEDPEDRRAKKISLTPKGVAMVRGSLEAGWAWMDQLAAAVGPTDRAAVTRTLETLSALAGDLGRRSDGPRGARKE